MNELIDNKEKIQIGKIIGTFGIKGELKVYSESDFVEHRFRKDARITIVSNRNIIECTVSSFRYHNKNILIRINNYNDINLVEKYIGYDIYADSDDEPSLDEDEYYIDDLVGMDVYDEANKLVGIVEDFIEVPQGYIMEVKKGKEKILVPFVDEYILEIDEDNIVIKVPEVCQ